MKDLKIMKFKFDIIFLDPPYKESKIRIIKNILKKILKKNSLLSNYIEIKKLKTNFLDKFKILEERTYGISKIYFGKF